MADVRGRFRVHRLGAIVAMALAAAACATRPTVVDEVAAPEPLPPVVAQFASAGEYRVEVTSGSLISAYGCIVEYELHEAAGMDPSMFPGGRPLVVLAHGFTRDLDSMRGWASLWASWGVDTVVASFCNSTLLSGNHDRNADDLVALAAELAPYPTPIVYAGFSAGGLAALLASAADARTTAYLGLDAVDSGSLAGEVTLLRLPALFLAAEPGSCNAGGNMISAMPPASPRLALRIPYTTHCDFENPTDSDCERFCGRIEPDLVRTEIRATVRSLATAWIVTQAGGDLTARTVFAHDTRAELERLRRIVTIESD